MCFIYFFKKILKILLIFKNILIKFLIKMKLNLYLGLIILYNFVSYFSLKNLNYKFYLEFYLINLGI